MATELGKAYVQIIPSAQGISGSISQAIGGEATSAGKVAGLNIVGALKGVIAAAGIGTFIKSTLDAGGALQQSFGGLDTIYGEAGEAAKKYAAEAAAAGISANDYAEQAVSFGASLKQAYGGDTVKAVEAANTAILDMTDNAAKMGTPIENIQNAYQGFAKQNYTMLDNLKLGYGGTKKEMERLLEDATRLSGVEYDISNLGDVYDAIHVIQQDLGLTGVAADEASTTFTGSMGAMKAAAQNLMANLALGQDVTTPLRVLVGNAQAFLVNNLLPMVKNILMGIPQIVNEVVTNIIPTLISDGQQLVTSLGEGLTTGIPQFIQQGLEFMSTFASNLRESAGQLVDVGLSFLEYVAEGIGNALPSLLTQLPQIIIDITGVLNDNLPRLFEAGWNMLVKLGEGIVSGLPEIKAAVPQIIDAIFSIWRATNFLQIGVDTLNNIVSGLLSALPTIIDMANTIVTEFISKVVSMLPTVLNAGVNILLNLVNGIVNNLPKIIESATKLLTNFINTISANLPQILSQGIIIIAKLAAGLIQAIPKVIAAIPQIVRAIINGFTTIDWASVGINLIRGIASGISSAVGIIVDAARDAARSAFEAAKNFLGINSPAKKGIYLGDMYAEGFALGIDDNADLVKDATNSLVNDAFNTLSTPQANFNITPQQTKSSGSLILNMTINGAEGQDVNALAEIIQEKINNAINSREFVYA